MKTNRKKGVCVWLCVCVLHFFVKTTRGPLSISPEFVCTTPKRAQKMSKQASLTSIFQVAFDNGASAKATFDDVVVETQPPQTRRCSIKTKKGWQCKNRVPLDSKYKLCDDCREIGKKKSQKRLAAFRADPAAQAAVAAQVVVPPGHVRCNHGANTPNWCKRTFSSKSKFKFCDECRASVSKSQQKRTAAFRADASAQAAAANQVVVPPGHVRCSHNANTPNQCKRTFSAKSKFKTCDECREITNKSDKKRRADPEVRAQKAEYDREYAQTPAGKASKKRSDKKPVSKLRKCLYSTLRDAGAQSRTLKELGTLSTNKAVKKHLESTFELWMNWANHGTLRHTDGYKAKWNIGHRIPCAVYSINDFGDARKCFDKRNLFAQDAKENIELRDRLALTNRELLKLKPIWPSEALIKGLDWFKSRFAPANATSHAVLSAKLQAEEEESEDEEEEEEEEESEGESEEEEESESEGEEESESGSESEED